MTGDLGSRRDWISAEHDEGSVRLRAYQGKVVHIADSQGARTGLARAEGDKNRTTPVKIHSVIALLVAGFAPAPSQAGDWYLNGIGGTSPYQIWAYGDDGLPLQASPVISPGSGISHIAWPSAIKVGSTYKVFASAYISGWTQVHLFTSTDGLSFTSQGSVFSANASEISGIGPTHVSYDPSASEPYTMYYLVRGAGGPGPKIDVATSVDGVTWTRQGTAVSASMSEETGGLSISYACRRADGEYVLLYHGYEEDLQNGTALVATSSSPLGPFTNKTVLMNWDDFESTLTGNAGENTGLVHSGAKVPIGIPLVVVGSTQEVIVAKRQDGTRLWFDRPLLANHSSTNLYSAARRKVDFSYLKEMPNGSWRAFATIYGPAVGVHAEYVTTASATALTGPWIFDGSGLRFTPWLSATQLSAENPTPLTSSDSCAN
jgi:hypothetical protein